MLDFMANVVGWYVIVVLYSPVVYAIEDRGSKQGLLSRCSVSD